MSQESWEVEKILNHRKNKNENEYLVKWKNCQNSENRWLKTSYFNSTIPIKDKKICTNFLSIINLMKTSGNGFFTVFDTNGKKVTLENKNGVIYVPHCEVISELSIDKTKNCYEDIPVTFKQNNETVNGF
jgi:hypothetical protein